MRSQFLLYFTAGELIKSTAYSFIRWAWPTGTNWLDLPMGVYVGVAIPWYEKSIEASIGWYLSMFTFQLPAVWQSNSRGLLLLTEKEPYNVFTSRFTVQKPFYMRNRRQLLLRYSSSRVLGYLHGWLGPWMASACQIVPVRDERSVRSDPCATLPCLPVDWCTTYVNINISEHPMDRRCVAN